MIDPAGFSAQLVQATRAGLDSNIIAQSTKAENKIAQFKLLDKEVTSLSTTLDDLLKNKGLSATATSVTQKDIIKATTSDGAAVGDYSVEVSQLAKPDRWGMSFTDEKWLTPQDGILKLDLGSESMSLDLSTLPADATLADLRNAINNAADNLGVQALIIRSGSSVELVLSAEKTGAANTISMSLSGGTSAAYAELDAAMTAKTQLSVAQDAKLKFNGIDITSATNKIENITDNLTIDLLKTNVGSPLTLSVDRDDESITSSLEKLVESYNLLKGRAGIATISGSGGKRAALSGDSSVTGMMQKLRATLSNLPDGYSLSSIGLKFNKDGDLSIDKKALEKSLDQDPDILNKVLLGKTGVVANMANAIEPYSDRVGVFDNRIKSLNAETKRLEDKKSQLDMQMDNLYKRYLNQFTALNSMQAQMEKTVSLFA